MIIYASVLVNDSNTPYILVDAAIKQAVKWDSSSIRDRLRSDIEAHVHCVYNDNIIADLKRMNLENKVMSIVLQRIYNYYMVEHNYLLMRRIYSNRLMLDDLCFAAKK